MDIHSMLNASADSSSSHPVRTPSSQTRKRPMSATEEPQQVKRQRIRPPWAIRVDHGPLLPMDQFVFKPREVRTPAERARIPLTVDTNGAGRVQDPPTATTTTIPQSARPWEAEPAGELEWSLDNNVPFNDVTRSVSNFLFTNVVQAPLSVLALGSIEIEARLGLLIDPNNDQRCSIPIETEAVLREGIGYRFESMMDQTQHKLLNDYLNAETRRSKTTPGRKPIAYRHIRERDKFFKVPKDFLVSLPEEVQSLRERYPHHRQRVRVTSDLQTGKILASIIKIRVADLEIFCPQEPFDVRLSVSLELDFPEDNIHMLEEHEENGVPQTRLKDRLSYKHQDIISVDLTQVRQEASGQRIHELELEMASGPILEQGRLAAEGQQNHYEAMCGILLNYVRVLNRASIPTMG